MEEKSKSKKNELTDGEKRLMLLSTFPFLILLIIGMAFLIESRADFKDDILKKVANEKSNRQDISAPYLSFASTNEGEKGTLCSSTVCYDLNIDVDTVKYSIFKFLVFDTEIAMKGQFVVTDEMSNVNDLRLQIDVKDRAGLIGKPMLKFDGDEYELARGIKKKSYQGDEYFLETKINLKEDVKSGDAIDYEIYMVLSGMDNVRVDFNSRLFAKLNVTSNFPTPHLEYDFTPENYELRDDGFSALWEVDGVKLSNSYQGVRIGIEKFPYDELYFYLIASAIMIVIMCIAMFVAEVVKNVDMDVLKYIIFCSLVVLSNLLLFLLCELMSFGASYLLTAIITIGLFIPYMGKSFGKKCSVVLGALFAFTFLITYLMLIIKSLAIIIGVVVLYSLLCVAMYFTAKRSVSSVCANENK